LSCPLQQHQAPNNSEHVAELEPRVAFPDFLRLKACFLRSFDWRWGCICASVQFHWSVSRAQLNFFLKWKLLFKKLLCLGCFYAPIAHYLSSGTEKSINESEPIIEYKNEVFFLQ
jgi:hypothetical protein